MARRGFGAVSAWERREADLFFADLLGVAPAMRTGGASHARRDVEEFFVELVGEPLLPAEFAEQPAQVVVPVPATIATKWAGVDRSNIPRRIVGGQTVGDTDWMGTLLDNSNLRFTGAYVTGPPPTGQPAAHFTASSRATARRWMPNIQTLTDQGWGVVLFYVGYSVGGGEPVPAGGTNRARGTAHGLHLRTILHGLGPAWAGATVFIDNEDSVGTNLTPDLIEYYLGLFDEMSRPDPNLAAFRPAFYGHGKPVEQMLARRRDLFVWDVKLATATTTTPNPAFDPAVDPLTVDPTTRPIRAYRGRPAGQSAFMAWSLGRQFWYYTGEMPAAGSAVATRLPTWRREPTWDYNVSFVRNPAFPVAEPRLAARVHAGACVVVADFFQPRGGGATPSPAARVTTQGPTQSTAIGTAAGVTVEPDAPLTLCRHGNDLLLATVLSGGGIGLATRSAAGTWTAIDRITGTVPPLRRARALRGVSNAVSNAHVFFIGADDRLYVKRRRGTGGWSDGQPVTHNLRLHPFSSLAGAPRRADTVDTFFIDDQGLLATAYWARWFTTPFPGFLVQRLQTAPSLLPGGALSAICPHPDHLLVFGVGADQRLHFASFVHGRGWSPVSAAGVPSDLIRAHGRLAAHAVSATEVEVVTLTDSGQLTIYPVRRTGAAWAAAARQVVADPPPLAAAAPPPPAGAVLQPASGFRINPFGDVSILRPAGQASSTVLCAGLRGGEARTLRWNAAGPDAWQWFV
jgi:hypothetical protein